MQLHVMTAVSNCASCHPCGQPFLWPPPLLTRHTSHGGNCNCAGWSYKNVNLQVRSEHSARTGSYGYLCVVHAHGDARSVEVEHRVLLRLAAVLRLESHRELARAGHHEIGRPVLVAVGVPAGRWWLLITRGAHTFSMTRRSAQIRV